MSAGLATACPQCGADAPVEDRFCEACGARLAPIAEIDAGIAAGLTNPGLVKHENQDALYLKRSGGSVVAVICDGVSSSVGADAAARVACAAAGGELSTSLATRDPEVAMRAAAAAAQRAVLGVPWEPRGTLTAPSCTFVAVVWDGRQVTVGSLGDSRAYWIDDETARQLTTDDTVGPGAGRRRPHDRARRRRPIDAAHEITRWLGEDTPDGPPAIVTFVPERPGRLAVCSDGLWNYAPTANAVAQLVRAPASTRAPLTITRALVDHALAAGGHDNITVAVIDVTPHVEGTEP